MKRQVLLSIALLSLSAGAFAQGTTPSDASAASAPKTRAEVKKETAAANKSGDLKAGGEVGTTPAPAKSTENRADVKASTKLANKEGKLPPRKAFDGSNDPKPKSQTTRTDVKASTKAANKSGVLKAGGEADAQPATPSKP